jgi:Do/DeqQ family serine protease
MQNVSTRQARTGRGAAVLALVAVVGTVGYGLGQTRSSQATASAAVNPRVTTALAATAPATSYAGVVNAVAPAVVTVRVEKKASPMPTDMPQLPDDPMLREFFGRRFQTPQQPRIPRQSGLGSGVITSADGYILTNNHVIDGADRVRVELTDSRTFDGKVIGTDPASDLALLKIEASNLPTLQIGDSSKVNVGDVVLAIGNPLGVGQAVTMGIISAKGRSTGLGDGYEDFLQTDAPINHGNSGGALINLNGELVGINSQILSPTGGNIGLGFAIPANMARQVMDQLKTDGRVSRGKLGVTIQSVTSDIAENLKLGAARGALVSAVEPGSPAARAGVRQGDVVVAVDGEQLADSNALRNRIAGTRPGSNVALEIVRDGRSQTLNATLDTLKPAVADRLSRREGADSDDFGLTVEALTPERARELELTRRTEGVLVRGVDPNGAAAASGLRAGDVIAQVNRQPVKSPSELRAALAKATDRPALLLVTRGNADVFLTIRNR